MKSAVPAKKATLREAPGTAPLSAGETRAHSTKAFLAGVINRIADPVFVKDGQRRLILVNDALCALTGHAREELLGKTDEGLFTPELAAIYRRADEGVLDKGMEDEDEGHLTDPSTGEERTIVTRKTRYIDPNGQRFLVGVIRDLTERKRAERALAALNADLEAQVAAHTEALRARTEQFELIVRTIEDVFWMADISFQTMFYVSDAYESVWHRPRKNLYDNARSFLDAIHPDDREKVLAYLGAERNGQPFDHEYRILWPDGTVRWIWDRGYPLADATGKISRYIGIAKDITDRKESDAALERIQRQHQGILAALGEGVHGIDRDGRIIFENPAAVAMLGCELHELIGQPAHPVMHHHREDGSPYPQAECPIYATLRDGMARHVQDEVFWRKDGSSFPVEYISTPMRDERGETIGTVVAFRDSTERRHMDRMVLAQSLEILRKNEALERANQMKSEFLATISHELRTPLNSVIGFTDLLKDGVAGALNATQGEFVADILDGGHRLLALVDGILEYTSLEEGRTPVELEPVELRTWIESCLAGRHAAAEANGVTTTLKAEADLGSADLDPRAVKRILDALLDNAIKFNRKGGQVTVTALREDDDLRILVTDTGIGIAREDLPRLFKPLVQLDSSLTRRHGGLGMGLALARRVAELQGGTIEVESEPGKGSQFTLRLPARGNP